MMTILSCIEMQDIFSEADRVRSKLVLQILTCELFRSQSRDITRRPKVANL